MRIATWNVNSVKQRIDNLTAWLAERAPDIVCLQETKTVDEAFPRGPIEDLGYNVAVHGQKTFNGVAILSKNPFHAVEKWDRVGKSVGWNRIGNDQIRMPSSSFSATLSRIRSNKSAGES